MSLVLYFLNGPNLNLLGEREPEIYGTETLGDIEAMTREVAAKAGASVEFRQSNHEGELVDWIHEARKKASALVLNAGAYTHTSIAIHDALKTLDIPIVELHLSNPSTREDFRAHSYVATCADGVIAGFGSAGYTLSVNAAIELINKRSSGNGR
jgi:3-dehydroquinate dehydratase-2